MKFKEKFVPAKFILRINRFVIRAELMSGEEIKAYCPSTGSLRSCYETGNRIFLRKNNNPKRKYRYTWILSEIKNSLVFINTQKTNYLVEEAINEGVIKELKNYKIIRSEVKSSQHTRLDFLLSNVSRDCYLEVKSITFVENGFYKFPDAPTKRGKKHLKELIKLKKIGFRTILLFVTHRDDANRFKPASDIDTEYAEILRKADNNGVEILVYESKVSLKGIEIRKSVKDKLI